MCFLKFSPRFADFLKSATGQFAKLPTCFCRNSHPPSLKILWNLPLDSLLSYLCVLTETPPWFADFLKSATGQFAKSPTYACRNTPPVADFVTSATGQFDNLPICTCRNPPSLQILWNLPLDSLLSYLHVFAEIPPSLQILWNLPLDSLLSDLFMLAEIPPSLQILWNLPLDRLLSFLYVLTKIPPYQFADFVKSATGQFAKLPICACRYSTPGLQILWNQPLNSLLCYLHVLAVIPPVCRFCKICHWTVC